VAEPRSAGDRRSRSGLVHDRRPVLGLSAGRQVVLVTDADAIAPACSTRS
jgi:hypothetical protein